VATFGKITVGSAAGGVDYATQTQNYNVPGGGQITVSEIKAYFHAAGNARVALYRAGTDLLLWESGVVAVSANAWQSFTVNQNFDKGDFRLALQGSVDNFFSREGSEEVNSPEKAMAFGAFPSPFTKDGDYTWTNWSIYAIYTDAGAPASVSSSGNVAVLEAMEML
jgi:hypothetical protein